MEQSICLSGTIKLFQLDTRTVSAGQLKCLSETRDLSQRYNQDDLVGQSLYFSEKICIIDKVVAFQKFELYMLIYDNKVTF